MSVWKEFNPSPTGRNVGDCAVRAVAQALDTTWETAYALIALNGFQMGDMPSSNSVWGAGIHTDIMTSSVRALVSAVNRLL